MAGVGKINKRGGAGAAVPVSSGAVEGASAPANHHANGTARAEPERAKPVRGWAEFHRTLTALHARGETITLASVACDDGPAVCHLQGCGFPVERSEGRSYARLKTGETVEL